MSTDAQVEEFRKKQEERERHAEEVKRKSETHRIQAKIDDLKKHLSDLEGKIKNAELHSNGKHQIITKTEKEENYIQEREINPKKKLIERHQEDIAKLQRAIEMSLQKVKHDQDAIAQKQHELTADEKTLEELNAKKNEIVAELQELDEELSNL